MIRIFSQSETTVVPPVTEQKSPPDLCTTGADSPVMADSSTEAMPSMTSPSPGMISLGLHHDDIALFQFAGKNGFLRAVRQQQTGLGVLLRLFQAGRLRFAAASATDSAKFAKQQ